MCTCVHFSFPTMMLHIQHIFIQFYTTSSSWVSTPRPGQEVRVHEAKESRQGVVLPSAFASAACHAVAHGARVGAQPEMYQGMCPGVPWDKPINPMRWLNSEFTMVSSCCRCTSKSCFFIPIEIPSHFGRTNHGELELQQSNR